MKQTQIIQNKTNLAIIFIQVRNSSGIFNETYYYLNNKLIARKDSNNKKYFYHPDHLGSTSLITNSSGSIVEETFYLPYGEVFEGGIQEIKLYTGKELDDTGFYYYGARYYDPYTTRFISPDLSLPDVYDPQQLNLYSYARNNPYKYVDESGKAIAIAPALIITGVAFTGYTIIFIKTYIETGDVDIAYQKATQAGVGGAIAATITYAFPPVGAGTALKSIARTEGFLAGLMTEKKLSGEQLTPEEVRDALIKHLISIGTIKGVESLSGEQLDELTKAAIEQMTTQETDGAGPETSSGTKPQEGKGKGAPTGGEEAGKGGTPQKETQQPKKEKRWWEIWKK